MSLFQQARLKFWIELFWGVMQKPPYTDTNGCTELNFAAFAMLMKDKPHQLRRLSIRWSSSSQRLVSLPPADSTPAP